MVAKEDHFKELLAMMDKAYTPYSHFRVACLILSDGGLFGGVNVENCAYSPSLCAERNAVGAMVYAGFRQIKKVFLLTDAPNGKFGTPCGVCRQVLREFATGETQVVVYNLSGEQQTYTLEQLLPLCFTSDSMK